MNFDRSIQRALTVQGHFKPPYCPNPRCKLHSNSTSCEKWWQSFGYNTTKCFPFRSRRFRCKRCFRTFTHTFFKLSYREKTPGLNESIFMHQIGGVSNREIARKIGHSECLIRSRLSKMARWGLLIQASLQQHFSISEPIVYDGLENFSYSQYDPNNINHAIGKHSAYTYDFNFAPINRKGRMSPRQKEIKLALEEQYGRYPKNILRTTSRRLFKRLLNQTAERSLILYSDEHFQYRRAVNIDLKSSDITHLTISSKAARNFRNPLFNVNNFDSQIRQKSAAFSRETISFAKHSIGMIEKFTLFMVFKNFLRPIFYKRHKSDPLVHKESPAQRAGIVNRLMTFKEFFKERVTVFQVALNEDWVQYVRRLDPLSRRTIRKYQGV